MCHVRCSFTVCVGLAMLLIGGLSGCGGSGAKTYPVTVKLAFPDGQTVEGAIVAFQSVPDPAANIGGKSVSAVGKIGPDGACQLTTYVIGDGAVAGLHRVTIAPPVPPPTDIGAPRPPMPFIPARYRTAATSGLEATVSPDGPNVIPIEIKRR